MGKVTNVCNHCGAHYLGSWELRVGNDPTPRFFCGLDCIFNWVQDEWLDAHRAKAGSRGTVGHYGTQILGASQ